MSPESVHRANANRDALSMALYERLFTRLVTLVNENLLGNNTRKLWKTISVLDIFGFEVISDLISFFLFEILNFLKKKKK